ncbi:hypothetical protein J3916_001837 [Salmonella enterica]|nr:hypothetical protein [Salmonella enterica]
MPLPLRDYYPIERSAELLECTIDDLLHWGEIGAIRLCLRFWNVNAYQFCDFSIFNEIMKDFNIPAIDFDDDLNPYIAYYYAVYRYVKNKDNGLKFIKEMKSKKYYDTACQLLTGFNGNPNSRIEVSVNRVYSEGFKVESLKVFNGDEYNCIFEIPVKLNGFFPLNKRFFTYKRAGVPLDEIKDNYIAISSFDFLTALYVTDSLIFHTNDIFILKDDFIKIKNASKNGGELTKTPGFDYLSRYDEKHSDKNKNTIEARNSATSIKIAKALIINHHPTIKNNPKKLAGVLETEIKKAGLGDSTVSKDTISRWMKGDY